MGGILQRCGEVYWGVGDGEEDVGEGLERWGRSGEV